MRSSRAGYIAWANSLLGRKEAELAALRKLAWSIPSAVRSIGEVDTTSMLDAQGRVAVLVGDTAGAEGIDSILAEQSAGAEDLAGGAVVTTATPATCTTHASSCHPMLELAQRKSF